MGVRARRLQFNPLDLLLAVEFTLVTFAVHIPWQLGTAGVDAVTYWDAARRWLAGQDPYANLGGLVFAAPPPTLAVLAPFSLLPQPAFVALMFGGSLFAAVFLLRRLRLPFWYLLFPPLVEGLLVGNPNVIVVALVVMGAPLADAAASFLKLYAVLPIALLKRTRSLIWVAVLFAITAPFLPWPSYVSHAVELVNVLNTQSSGGRSAIAFPLLIPFTILALVIVGRQRSAWLVVPALWPATQVHYSLLALPVAGRLMAGILAVPLPGAPVAAVLAEAVAVLWRRRQPVGSLTIETG